MNPRYRTTRQLTLGYLSLGTAVGPLETIDAAVAAGFGAISPRICGRAPGDPWPSMDGVPDVFSRIKAHAEETEIRIPTVTGYTITPSTTLEHLAHNIEAARQLGAGKIIQACYDTDVDRVAALMREYAAAARDAGLRIALEFTVISELKTIAQSLALIERVGAGNVGLTIDTLHVVRSGASAADVAALDPSLIYVMQLSDAPAALPAGRTVLEEAMAERLYVGEGELHLEAFVAAVSPAVELEVETPVGIHARLSSTERARISAAAAAKFFTRRFA